MENCEFSAVNRLKNAIVGHCLEYRREGGGSWRKCWFYFYDLSMQRHPQDWSNDESTIAMSQHMHFDMCVQSLDACAKGQSLHCSTAIIICPICHLQMLLSGCILKWKQLTVCRSECMDNGFIFFPYRSQSFSKQKFAPKSYNQRAAFF